jgi:8-oxo-dGTP pyrophosphatase MutT (NUDIX family)
MGLWYIETNMREISAGIIAYRTTADGPRFLILYHGHNYWNFPKGKIESEEKSFQTAVREVREETGLTRNDLRFNENFKTSENFTFWRNKEKIYKTIVFYLAETTQQRIKLPEQTDAEGEKHEGYGWFTYKEALKVLTKEDSQQVLKQAYNFLRNIELRKRGPIRRPQPGVNKEKDGEKQLQERRPNVVPQKREGYLQPRRPLPPRTPIGGGTQAPRPQGMPNRPYGRPQPRPQQGGVPKTHDIGQRSSEPMREGGQRPANGQPQRPAPIRREPGNTYR